MSINRRNPTPKDSTISLWRTNDENGALFQGKIQLNLFMLKRIERQPINEEGIVELDVSLFPCLSNNPGAPYLKGVVTGLDKNGYDERYYTA